MKRSEHRFLTTHVGSLPRPPALRDLLVQQDRGEAVDPAALAREAEAAVSHVVRKQLEAGVDVGNDGEQPRVGFSTYPARRRKGFGGASKRRMSRDMADHPDYLARLSGGGAGAARINDAPQAIAEVAYTDLGEAVAECELFQRCAGGGRGFAEPFMTAASPGVIATIMLDVYAGSHERCVRALAREMRKEYELIVQRGFVLQLDCPDLAMERARFFQDEPLDRFLAAVALHVEAINEAVKDLPADRIRLHLCWGNYDGPHTHDVPLEPPGGSGAEARLRGCASLATVSNVGEDCGMRGRRRLIVTMALVSVILIGAFVGTATAQAKPEGEMRWALYVTLSPLWFDPSEVIGQLTPFWILYGLHDALVKPMPGNLQAPCLAESWTVSPDQRVYEFKLREGLKFHNGDPFTAEDVKFSFQRSKGARQVREKVRALEVVGHNRISFPLHKP